jgi:hypothetical protein
MTRIEAIRTRRIPPIHTAALTHSRPSMGLASSSGLIASLMASSCCAASWWRTSRASARRRWSPFLPDLPGHLPAAIAVDGAKVEHDRGCGPASLPEFFDGLLPVVPALDEGGNRRTAAPGDDGRVGAKGGDDLGMGRRGAGDRHERRKQESPTGAQCRITHTTNLRRLRRCRNLPDGSIGRRSRTRPAIEVIQPHNPERSGRRTRPPRFVRQ